MRRRKASDQGFTLLEVILVVAILGFGITATSVLFVANLRAGTSNREYAACTLLITDIMERLRSLPFKGDTGQKTIMGLINELSENPGSNSLLIFYNFLGTSPPSIASQVIPEIFSLKDGEGKFMSKLEFTPQTSSSYTVEVTLQWKENMAPVIVKNLIAEGGLNDFLQK